MRSQVPSYRQLADKLRAAIAAGEFGTDGPVPSLRRLSQETGLAMATVQHAMAVLRDEGLIVAVSGRGTFVASQD